MKNFVYTSLMAMSASLGLCGAAIAQEEEEEQECGGNYQEPCEEICHNIGGPEELGANCDGATGACTFTLDTGFTITVAKDHFLGIIIPPTTEGAIAAHLAHGDGLVRMVFDPPLHLASTGQNHQASNVECMAMRETTTQPPEPGN